jgi:hypothetical protein
VHVDEADAWLQENEKNLTKQKGGSLNLTDGATKLANEISLARQVDGGAGDKLALEHH